MMKRHMSYIDFGKRDDQQFTRCLINLRSLISKSVERSARSLAAEMTLLLMQSLEDDEFISILSDSRHGG